jgi:hypothetical protein
MITQVSAIFDKIYVKSCPFFKKNNVMIKVLHYLALFCAKNANLFRHLFGENIFKT